MPSTVAVNASFFESGDQNRPFSVELGIETRRIRSWMPSKSIDDLRPASFGAVGASAASPFGLCSPSFALGRGLLGGTGLVDLLDGLLDRAVAARLLVVLGREPDVVDVDLRLAAPAGEGDHLAVGRPDRVAVSLSGCRETLNGGFEPSTGMIQMSRLKSLSSTA